MIAAASPIRRLITAADTFSLDLSSLNALAALRSCVDNALRSPMVEVVLCGAYLRWRQWLPVGLHHRTRLYESVGFVAVSFTPVHVNMMCTARPVVVNTLLCSCFIKHVHCYWHGNTHYNCIAANKCINVISWKHDWVGAVRYPSPLRVMTGLGFAPSHPLVRISWFQASRPRKTWLLEGVRR